MRICYAIINFLSKLKSELALCKDKESEYQKLLNQKDEIIEDLRNLILESNQCKIFNFFLNKSLYHFFYPIKILFIFKSIFSFLI